MVATICTFFRRLGMTCIISACTMQKKLLVGGDQVLCTGYPPIMPFETKADQLSLLLQQTERLGKLSASLVLTGHGKEDVTFPRAAIR